MGRDFSRPFFVASYALVTLLQQVLVLVHLAQTEYPIYCYYELW
jgi:hypothetical protein